MTATRSGSRMFVFANHMSASPSSVFSDIPTSRRPSSRAVANTPSHRVRAWFRGEVVDDDDDDHQVHSVAAVDISRAASQLDRNISLHSGV